MLIVYEIYLRLANFEAHIDVISQNVLSYTRVIVNGVRNDLNYSVDRCTAFLFLSKFSRHFRHCGLSYVSEISTHVTSGQPHDNADRISSVR